MESNKENIVVRMTNFIYYIFDTPVTFFREKIVEPNQKKYPWYHQQYRRVPTIDECYPHEMACIQEANEQFERDKLVDDEILVILRRRYEDCVVVHGEDQHVCQDLYQSFKDGSTAWFIKYGDLGFSGHVIRAFMKQKHRMVWERRNGPVGSGIKDKYDIGHEEKKDEPEKQAEL